MAPAGVLVALLGALFGLLLPATPVEAEAVAASTAPVNIAILVSSRDDLCYDPGDVAAIRHLTTLERDRINLAGGINGRPVLIEFLDDRREAKQTIANVARALDDRHTVAMVGLANSTRAKEMLEAVGGRLRENGMPFISDISVNSLFAAYPSVFTTRASQDDDRLPVLAAFMKAKGVKRPAFIGIKDALFSTTLGEGLKGIAGPALVGDYRLTLKDNALDASEVAAAVAGLKESSPDLLFLTIGGNRSADILAKLVAAGVTPPLFVAGRIESIFRSKDVDYPSDVYQLAWDGLPDASNDRLRQRIVRSGRKQWQFEGHKNSGAPGWKTGECKPRAGEDLPDIFDSANMRAIGVGAQFGDMVGLIAEALKSAPPNADTTGLRAHLLGELKTAYATGHGAFQGSLANWSFRQTSRAAAKDPFIVMRRPGLEALQLAPLQFVRLRKDVLRPIDTLYMDIDLIRTFRIDDNEKSYFADFYLSMRGNKGARIEQFEFANAFLDARTNDRQINIRELHDGGPSATFPEHMRIYRVSGKFMFEPRLANFPFDTQRFSIDIQPRSGDSPFIIQPPPHTQRDRAVETDGWDPNDHYVGYDEDFVPVIDAMSHERSVVPFYRASFVWLMKRQTTDYYLRVVVPLAFILIVAYLSIFIPAVHFEAIVTIQVTALLSAVALYLALPKIDTDSATLSDRIFLFDYMAVSLMIVISILRINGFVAATPALRRVLGFIHIVVVPLLVVAMAMYVYGASLLQG